MTYKKPIAPGDIFSEKDSRMHGRRVVVVEKVPMRGGAKWRVRNTISQFNVGRESLISDEGLRTRWNYIGTSVTDEQRRDEAFEEEWNQNVTRGTNDGYRVLAKAFFEKGWKAKSER